MDTHEYQAKTILKRYGIPIPPFEVAQSLQEVKEIIAAKKWQEGVIKIQVHAGGRGKAGGVQFARSQEEIVEKARALLGMKMVNAQTGPVGMIAHKVLITEKINHQREYYLGAIIDREAKRPILIASPAGGMDIEEITMKNETQMLQLPISLAGTVKSYHQLRLATFMGWTGKTASQGLKIVRDLARAFIETDSSLIEINPLVATAQGDLWAIDAKLSIDDNALFRQQEIETFYDPTQILGSEVVAKKANLAYIALEGNIGCMVNGAGLAMATMDIIHHYGGKPANFLDVGGSASQEKVTEGFKIIVADPNVKGIFVNIFGGIMDCATIAQGLIVAAKELAITIPLVVRLEGTNVEKGRFLLQQSNLNMIFAEKMAKGATKVVHAVQEESQ